MEICSINDRNDLRDGSIDIEISQDPKEKNSLQPSSVKSKISEVEYATETCDSIDANNLEAAGLQEENNLKEFSLATNILQTDHLKEIYDSIDAIVFETAGLRKENSLVDCSLTANVLKTEEPEKHKYLRKSSLETHHSRTDDLNEENGSLKTNILVTYDTKDDYSLKIGSIETIVLNADGPKKDDYLTRNSVDTEHSRTVDPNKENGSLEINNSNTNDTNDVYDTKIGSVETINLKTDGSKKDDFFTKNLIEKEYILDTDDSKEDNCLKTGSVKRNFLDHAHLNKENRNEKSTLEIIKNDFDHLNNKDSSQEINISNANSRKQEENFQIYSRVANVLEPDSPKKDENFSIKTENPDTDDRKEENDLEKDSRTTQISGTNSLKEKNSSIEQKIIEIDDLTEENNLENGLLEPDIEIEKISELDVSNYNAPVCSKIDLTDTPEKFDDKSFRGKSKKSKKRKKKKKKSRHELVSSGERSAIIAKQESVLKSNSDFSFNDDDLCIRDFEVEISSFNLSKPVLLNLDTYRIEPTINNDMPIISEPTENLEVSLDPSLFFPELLDDIQIVDLGDDDSDSDVYVAPNKVAEVSLLTSSDDDDVILQEPNIETIEVSDAGSDDEPLAKLMKLPLEDPKTKKKKTKTKYTCGDCTFFTFSKPHHIKHLNSHKYIYCNKCQFRCTKEKEMTKHYKSHILKLLCERNKKKIGRYNTRSKVGTRSVQNKRPATRKRKRRPQAAKNIASVEI